MNHLGRRGSTLFLTVPAYFSGYILMGSAKNLAMIVVGRFLTGKKGSPINYVTSIILSLQCQGSLKNVRNPG